MVGERERQIHTVRNVLVLLLTQHPAQPDNKTLRNLMMEAEATSIMNCRPLTVDTINYSRMPEPLTPNHVLKVILSPPGEFLICTPGSDGVGSSFSPLSFGQADKRITYCLSSWDRSGWQPEEISKKMTLSLSHEIAGKSRVKKKHILTLLVSWERFVSRLLTGI